MSAAAPPTPRGVSARPGVARGWVLSLVAVIVLAAAALLGHQQSGHQQSGHQQQPSYQLQGRIQPGTHEQPGRDEQRGGHDRPGRDWPGAESPAHPLAAGRVPPATSVLLTSRAAVRLLQPAPAVVPWLGLFALLIGVFWRVTQRCSALRTAPARPARERGPPVTASA